MSTANETKPLVAIFAAAPLDRYARQITTGLAYLGGLMMLPIFFAYLSNMRWGGLIVPVALALPLAIFLLLCYGLQPVSYQIDDEHVVIVRRHWRKLRLPLDTISAASLAASLADVPRRGLRFAFNPGVFGYQGPFLLQPYGETFFLATNRERFVALARPGKPPLIISPANPRALIEELDRRRADYALKQLTRHNAA